jgi:hypothetical protein
MYPAHARHRRSLSTLRTLVAFLPLGVIGDEL